MSYCVKSGELLKSGITLAKLGSAVVRSEHVPVALLEA